MERWWAVAFFARWWGAVVLWQAGKDWVTVIKHVNFFVESSSIRHQKNGIMIIVFDADINR